MPDTLCVHKHLNQEDGTSGPSTSIEMVPFCQGFDPAHHLRDLISGKEEMDMCWTELARVLSFTSMPSWQTVAFLVSAEDGVDLSIRALAFRTPSRALCSPYAPATVAELTTHLLLILEVLSDVRIPGVSEYFTGY